MAKRTEEKVLQTATSTRPRAVMLKPSDGSMVRRPLYDPKDGTWTNPLPISGAWLQHYLRKGFLLDEPAKPKKKRTRKEK